MPWHTSVAFSASWLVKSIPCNRPNEPEVIVIGVLRLLWWRSFRLLHAHKTPISYYKVCYRSIVWDLSIVWSLPII